MLTSIHVYEFVVQFDWLDDTIRSSVTELLTRPIQNAAQFQWRVQSARHFLIRDSADKETS
jgi:hypothetical protein